LVDNLALLEAKMLRIHVYLENFPTMEVWQ
jgi:hypothetical protein